MCRKFYGDGHFFSLWPPLGNLQKASPTGDFEERMKGALGMGLLSMKGLRGGGLGGGNSFTGDPGRYVQIVSGHSHLSP